MSTTLFILLSYFTILCSGQSLTALSPGDPSSYSRPELAIIKHISLSLNVDFEKQVLNGEATLHISVLNKIRELPLDISKLKIICVEQVGGSELRYETGEHIPNVGSKLTIHLKGPASKGEMFKIKIKYRTDPSASGLTWLKASQTSGKEHPYLFSQSSPIHARSIVPCQDTPAVKFTFNAEVTAPEEFTVLMGALCEDLADNVTTFNQPIPIPSNLFAIAVGVLESRFVGPRSKVWSEKEDVERNSFEFAETETYLQAAEKLCGAYVWSQYDLLVLPPAFPHGAMENTCLTFYSPTVVVGDRSLSDVTIHEIIHSWTGNLVSIKNFEHFWLKEGFTVFLERKLTASLINDTVEAKRRRDFHSLLGLQQLTEGVNTLGEMNPLTKMVLKLDGVHPDEAFSIIPYEKGSLFLRYLEDLLGGPKVFDAFIRSYIRHFSMQSIDTDQFKSYFMDYFQHHTRLGEIDWYAWLYSTGMPPIIPDFDATLTESVTTLVSKIPDPNFKFCYDHVKSFDIHQMIYLLQQLIERAPLPLQRLKELGQAYKVIGNKNNEILYRWLRLSVRSRDENILGEVYSFLNSSGRLKYVRPLYRELYDWKEVRGQAIDNFLQNEKNMSHLTSFNLRKDLHLSNQKRCEKCRF